MNYITELKDNKDTLEHNRNLLLDVKVLRGL